jgi:hypothetical protein
MRILKFICLTNLQQATVPQTTGKFGSHTIRVNYLSIGNKLFRIYLEFKTEVFLVIFTEICFHHKIK